MSISYSRQQESVAKSMSNPAATIDAGEPVADAASVACCAIKPGESALPAEDSVALAARFKALSDPNRLRILSMVSSNVDAETCVCDLPGPLGLGQSTVSHHLKILVEAGLLNREKRGVWAYYSLVPGALEALAATLHPKK